MNVSFVNNIFRKKINKKADMTVSTLIKVILAILVLVIIVSIVWNYSNKASKNAQGTADNIGTDTDITSGYCGVLGVRKCCDTEDDKWKFIGTKTGFVDCTSEQKCCKKVEVS